MVDNCKIFSASSAALKGCAVLLGVVFVVHCVGFGTDYWVKTDVVGLSHYSGLWKHCSCLSYNIYSSIEKCFCLPFSDYIPGWMRGVQALESIGLITIVVVGVMVFMQLFFTQRRDIKIWGILLTFFSGISILSGVALYGAMMVHYLNFSFGLCTSAGILCLLCAFLLIQDRNSSPINQQTSRRQPYRIQYASQGHVIQPPQTQAVISFTSQTQSPGYQPPYAHAQYGPPPSYLDVQQHNQQMQPYNVQQSYPAAK